MVCLITDDAFTLRGELLLVVLEFVTLVLPSTNREPVAFSLGIPFAKSPPRPSGEEALDVALDGAAPPPPLPELFPPLGDELLGLSRKQMKTTIISE